MAGRQGLRPIRVGLVCPYDMSRPGGVQAQVAGLAAALDQLGDEPHVIAPGAGRTGRCLDLGATVSVPANRSRAPLSPDPRVRERIEEYARGEGLQLLHVHEPLMPTVSVLALRAGLPVLATLHADPGRLVSAAYRIAGRGLRAALGPDVRGVTAVSATAAAAMPRIDVEIIPNGIDTGAFAQPGERGRGRVVFLGRDEPRKGLDVLLEAWPAVSAAVPDAELVALGPDRGLEGITWVPRPDDEEKRRWLGTAEVLVAPNLGGESFGIVVLEGMAAGAAVAASRLRAFADVAGDAARYFEVGDAEDLAETLVEMLGDPALVERLARAGRRRAAGYDWSNVAAAYRRAYVACLEGERPRTR